MSIHHGAILWRQRGYHLLREIGAGPSPDELRFRDHSIVCPVMERGARALAVPPSWVPFPSVGPEKLYVAPSADEAALPARFIQPLVCRKRGDPRAGLGYVGVDSRVLTRDRWSGGSSVEREPCPAAAELPEIGPPRPHHTVGALLEASGMTESGLELLAAGRRSCSGPRVAVIDADCGGWGALGGAVDEDSLALGPGGKWLQFPRTDGRPARERRVAGHGVVMAGVVNAVAPAARIGLFEAPFTQSSYLYPTDLAAAIARAAGAWDADVILVALAHGSWGMPAHLRAILQAAARSGRRGRGTAVVCCSGRIDQNRDVHGDSAALAGDDLASQPWTIAVSACALDGRWYRVNGYPLSRLGPSIDLCAPGEMVTLPDLGTADDSSLAAAVVAGAAARVLERNPTLELADLRHLLRITAGDSGVDDAAPGAGIEAGRLNERDRSGHNFKVGHGKVHVLHSCLAAADPVCYALLATRHGPDEAGADELAQGWECHLRRAAAAGSPAARAYLRLRRHLVPRVIASQEARDAVFWLARHLRAVRRDGAHTWTADEMDHGALADRVEHALDAIARAPGRGDDWICRWIDRLVRGMSAAPAATVRDLVALALDFPCNGVT